MEPLPLSDRRDAPDGRHRGHEASDRGQPPLGLDLRVFCASAVNRVGAFVVVGAVGFAFQLTVLAVLISFAHWTWLPPPSQRWSLRDP